MMQSIIDAHIHLDVYCRSDREKILHELEEFKINALVAVSQDLQSAKKVLKIASNDERVKPAVGYHPEQELPTDSELIKLQALIEEKQDDIVAIGEVGLPYYLQQEDSTLDLEPYIDLLQFFIEQANNMNKPIVLHAIYEDATIACDLLEKYSIQKALFHWFKGDEETIARMIDNGYFISITPDVLYEEETRKLVKKYPLSLMFVETDGPWPFKGPFEHQMTHPKMIHATMKEISHIKNIALADVYEIIFSHTERFYSI